MFFKLFYDLQIAGHLNIQQFVKRLNVQTKIINDHFWQNAEKINLGHRESGE